MAGLLSQALAPVFQAFRARGRSGTESDGTVAEGGRIAARAVPSETVKALPEIDYPVPLVVKNTFIDAGVDRPFSLEGFYLEREIHSTPVSAIDVAAGRWEVPFEPSTVAKHRLGRSIEPDGSSSRRSTSAGSSSGRSGSDESPSTQSELSPRDAAEPCRPADPASQGASSAPSLSGLPDFEYPAPFFVKNTFIDTDIGRPFSIDGFFEERQLRSCPGSALYSPPDKELAEDVFPAGATRGEFQELESSVWLFATSTPECTPLLPHCQPMRLPFSIPLPPAEPAFAIPLPPVEPPVLPADLAPVATPAPPAPASAPAAPVLRLSDALEAEVLGSPALPTVGSSDHHLGTCKPCAHAHSAKGCKNGAQCAYCHLCPPGELKRQQKAKRMANRKAQAE